MTRRLDQRGLTESVQWAAVIPVVLLAILGLIQGGVMLHARTVVRDAAAVVAQTQSRMGADPTQARPVAERVVASADLEQVQVTVTRSDGVLTATVAGKAPTFFDVGVTTVSASASMPLEEP